MEQFKDKTLKQKDNVEDYVDILKNLVEPLKLVGGETGIKNIMI